jgi:hypothetical protein
MRKLLILSALILGTLIASAEDQGARIRMRSGVGVPSGPPPGDACVENEGPITANVHPRIGITECTLSSYQSMYGTGGRYAPGTSGTDYGELVSTFLSDWATLETVNVESDVVAATLGTICTAYGVAGVTYTPHASAQDWCDKGVAVMDAVYAATAPASPIAYALDPMYAVAYDHLWATLGDTKRGQWATHAYNTCRDGGTAGGAGGHEVYPATQITTQTQTLWATCMLWALALKGDGYYDTWAAGYVAEWPQRFRSVTGLSNINSFLVGDDGGGDLEEGVSYSIVYDFHHLYLVELAYQTAFNIDKTTHYSDAAVQWIRKTSYYYLRNKLPNNNQFLLPFYGNIGETLDGGGVIALNIQAAEHAAEGVSIADAQLAEWLKVNITGDLGTSGVYMRRWGGYWFLFATPTAPTANSPDTLGIPTYEDDTNFRIFLRDGTWASTDTPLVYFTTMKWNNHSSGIRENCPASFGVYLKGWAIDRAHAPSGHYWGATQGIGACNGVFFPKPADSAGPPMGTFSYYDGGGRRYNPVEWTSLDDLDNGSVWDSIASKNTVIRSGSNRATYVYQDIGRAYSGTEYDEVNNDQRVDAYSATQIYFHPATANTDLIYIARLDRTQTLGGAGTYVATDVLRWNGLPSLNGGSSSALGNFSPTCSLLNTGYYGSTGFDCPTTPVNRGATITNDTTLLDVGVNTNGFDNHVWVKYLTSGLEIVRIGGANAGGTPWNSNNTIPGSEGEYSHEHVDQFGVALQTSTSGVSATLRQYMSTHATWARLVTPAANTQFFKWTVVGRYADTAPTFSSTFTSGAGTGFMCSIVNSVYAACFAEGAALSNDAKTSGAVIWNTADDNIRAGWGHLGSGTRTFQPGANINMGNGFGMSITCTPNANKGFCEIPDIDSMSAGTGADNTITVS